MPKALELPAELETPYNSGLTAKQLEAIGATILNGSILDAWLAHSIWVLLQVKSSAMVHEGTIVTSRINASAKLDLFKRLARIRIRRIKDKKLSKALKAELSLVISCIDKSVTTRNNLAHGRLRSHSGGTMHFRVKNDRRLDIVKITSKELYAAPQAAIEAAAALSNFTKHFDLQNQQPT